MVYWQDDRGVAKAGKLESDVCSKINTKKVNHTYYSNKDLQKYWIEEYSLCLAQVLQRQKGMNATMMKTNAPRTIPTMR